MAGNFKTVTIGGNTYQLPLSGSNPPWGEQLEDLLDAMVDAINLTQGSQDITETSASLSNTSGLKNVLGLGFDSNVTRSAEISYNITRSIIKTISAIPAGTGVITITCSDKHDLFTGDIITIANSNSSVVIDGVHTVTKLTDNTFSIDIGASVIATPGTSATFTTQLVESGTLLLNYGQQGWGYARFSVGDSKVDLSVTSAGLVQYNPVVLEGSSHSGLMKFIAKALLST